MTKRRNFLKYGLRSAAGLVGAGIAAAVVGFLCIVPLPGFTALARSELVTPTPTDQRLICPGALVDVLSLNGDATAFGAVGVPEYVTSGRDTSITQTALAAPDDIVGDELAQPQQLFAPAPTTDVTPLIAGVQSQQATTESLAGLATAACTEASTDAWLVGGSTETGRTTLLFLTNPTEVSANVTIAVLGEQGWVAGPGSTGIVVEPGTQRILSMAALAPNVNTPVVHVTSTGGQVVPTLQQSVVRTLLPDGVELISQGASPNVSLVIPGVRLSGMATHQASEGGMVTSDEEPAVRIGVPGTKEATATVTAYGVSGEPVIVKATVPAERVLELPFGSLPDGIYTLVVTATEPVVAAARTINYADTDPFTDSTAAPTPVATSTPRATGRPTASATPAAAATLAPWAQTAALDGVGGDGPVSGAPVAPGQTLGSGGAAVASPLLGGDFTWNVATLAIVGDTVVNVSSAPHPTLTVFNASESDVTLRLSQDDTSLPDVTIPANGVRAVSLAGGARYVLSTEAPLYATVSYAAKGLGASMPLTPASPLGSGIRVYPR